MKHKQGVTLIEVLIVIYVVGIIAAIGGVLWGNKNFITSVDKEQAEQTEIAMQEATRQIGMPNIVNFQQRKLMKMVYELTDKEDLICYAYIKSDYQGKLIFIGKTIGFGVPFSAQYTNPERIAKSYAQGGFAILPQADPNGLFMPSSSSATWLMMIDPETNEVHPVYLEPEIVVSPFPLHNISEAG